MIGRLRRVVRRSLIARLVFSFLGVSVAMVIAVAVIAYHEARGALRGEVVARLGAIADSKEKQLDRWVDAQRIEVEYIARLAQRHFDAPPILPRFVTPVERNSGAILSALLRRTTMRTPEFREIFILTVPGPGSSPRPIPPASGSTASPMTIFSRGARTPTSSACIRQRRRPRVRPR